MQTLKDNKLLQAAWEFVENTGRSIFLTGKAGTGKTTFLKYVVANSHKRTVVVAPTGVAAINAGGMTIHSFFQIPLSPYIPGHKFTTNNDGKMAAKYFKYDFGKEKRKIIKTLDLLIIDEISMVRSDLLDAIDHTLRQYRDRFKPFGGVQLLMIGDLAQLTPVVTSEEETLLKQYYSTPYFFGSHALQQTNYVTIQLEHIYRQQDDYFVNLLNAIRDGHPTNKNLDDINSRFQPDFKPNSEEGYIRLTTHNTQADNYNDSQLRLLTTKAYTYHASIEGQFPEFSHPTATALTLKKGAQVMFIKNDSTSQRRYYNGLIGIVTAINDESIEVTCQEKDEPIEVNREVWENVSYSINEKTGDIESHIKGSFTQYPLRLAWAITIHKSQGLTFDKAIIDAASAFAPGQVYVALSRCRTLEGLILSSKLNSRAIINDKNVADYISNQEQAAQESIQNLPTIKDEYYKFLLCELFDFTDIGRMVELVNRLMIEFFTRSNPSSTHLAKVASEEFHNKVTNISLRWRTQIESLTIEQLKDHDFQKRINDACAYFCDTLTELLVILIKRLRDVKSGNKTVMERLKNYLDELQMTYQQHQNTMSEMLTKPFSTQHFLQSKARAWLEVIDITKTQTTKKRRKTTSQRKRTETHSKEY